MSGESNEIVQELEEPNEIVQELENKVMVMQLQIQEMQDTLRAHNEVLRKFRMLKV